MTDEFPAQRASNAADNVSIWWRHHVNKEADDISIIHKTYQTKFLYGFCLTSCRRHYITGILFRGCFGCSQVAITRCILMIQYNLVGDISLIDIWHIERKISCKHWDHVITDVRYHSYIYIYIYIYALADLTVQMLTLLHNYLDRQSQYSNTWNSTFLALTAQVARAFGMNSKVGGSSLPQVETFFVSKSSTLSQEHPFVTPKWMLVPAHS